MLLHCGCTLSSAPNTRCPTCRSPIFARYDLRRLSIDEKRMLCLSRVLKALVRSPGLLCSGTSLQIHQRSLWLLRIHGLAARQQSVTRAVSGLGCKAARQLRHSGWSPDHRCLLRSKINKAVKSFQRPRTLCGHLGTAFEASEVSLATTRHLSCVMVKQNVKPLGILLLNVSTGLFAYGTTPTIHELAPCKGRTYLLWLVRVVPLSAVHYHTFLT